MNDTVRDRLEDAEEDATELVAALRGHALESLALGLLIRIQEALEALP